MPIFKTSFSKFSLKIGVENGAKIDIKMTTKIDEILSAFWSCLGGAPELMSCGQVGGKMAVWGLPGGWGELIKQPAC